MSTEGIANGNAFVSVTVGLQSQAIMTLYVIPVYNKCWDEHGLKLFKLCEPRSSIPIIQHQL